MPVKISRKEVCSLRGAVIAMKIFLTKKRLAAVIALTAFAAVFIILLNNNFFITAENCTAGVNCEELNEAYSDVFEINRKKLDNVMEYGDEFCSGYISTKKDLAVHERILSQLKELSDEICGDARTDYEKVRKIEYWVADNIYYNYVSAESAVTADTISLETVLETKAATCAGYSNLFSALCNMQDIYCVNLRGGTFIKSDSSESLMSIPMNHEWNAAKTDDGWFFCDVTWLSNNEYTQEGYKHSDTMDEPYAEMTFEFMSYEHRIDMADFRDFKSSVNAFNPNNQ